MYFSNTFSSMTVLAIRIFGIVICACVSLSAQAAHLETIGPVYPITEPDLLEAIKANLAEKQRTGEIDRLQKKAVARFKDSLNNPTPVAGITTATISRTYYFDPSVTADRTYTDDKGRIIVMAGTRVNPLDHLSLSNRYLFLDGRDPAQVSRAKILLKKHSGRIKPILTAGSYLDLMKAWKRPVYFDQFGRLTTHFHIRHVPALVSQEGNKIRIDEIAP